MERDEPRRRGSWPPSGPPVSDDDRRAVIDRMQAALAEDRLGFDELDDRWAAVQAAQTMEELEVASAALPEVRHQPPPPEARHFTPATTFSVLGDTKIGGWLAAGPSVHVTSIVGDVVVDLSSAAIGPDGVDVEVNALIGDVKVIVPDGARVRSQGISIIGDRKERLVTPTVGGPVVRVTVRSLIGGSSLYSLSLVPEGALRRLWSALRGNRPN